jgi:hypothetical protein
VPQPESVENSTNRVHAQPMISRPLYGDFDLCRNAIELVQLSKNLNKWRGSLTRQILWSCNLEENFLDQRHLLEALPCVLPKNYLKANPLLGQVSKQLPQCRGSHVALHLDGNYINVRVIKKVNFFAETLPWSHIQVVPLTRRDVHNSW